MYFITCFTLTNKLNKKLMFIIIQITKISFFLNNAPSMDHLQNCCSRNSVYKRFTMNVF